MESIQMNPPPNDTSIWIGKAAMAQLIESFNPWCQHYLEMKSPDKGAYQLTEFLTELMAITGIRLRLVREHPEHGREELDLSALNLIPVEGVCEAGTIEAWLRAGAALVADADDLVVRRPPNLEVVRAN